MERINKPCQIQITSDGGERASEEKRSVDSGHSIVAYPMLLLPLLLHGGRDAHELVSEGDQSIRESRAGRNAGLFTQLRLI